MFLHMRLSKKEIQVILRVAKEIYGEGVEVYLFGSRINDEKIDIIGDHEDSPVAREALMTGIRLV